MLSHYAAATLVSGGILTVPEPYYVADLPQYKFGPFRCDGDHCACRLFSEDRSLWNQFERWVGR